MQFEWCLLLYILIISFLYLLNHVYAVQLHLQLDLFFTFFFFFYCFSTDLFYEHLEHLFKYQSSLVK